MIIPMTGKISWRNPPAVTIGIILLNCLIFGLFQLNDNEKRYQSIEYYFQSGLVKIEVPIYLNYLNERSAETPAVIDPEEIDDETYLQSFMQMERDFLFLKKLRNDGVISKGDPEYAAWRALRNNYEKKLSRSVAYRYGLKPAYRDPITFITHMFLHGSFGHLFGNMLFLWIIGCMLEMGCGRILFPVLYITGGLCAVGFYWIFNINSTIPLVGASGAIAGIMGAFTVLYGRKKIDIFFTLGFYFDYRKIPAIILLPIWIGRELYQLSFGGASNVAYTAHIGGLIGGSILGIIILKTTRVSERETFQEAPKDDVTPLLEKALDRIGVLDFDGGRRLIRQVLDRDPDNIDGLTHLFNMDKTTPDHARFHDTTTKILFHLCRHTGSYEKAYTVFREYKALVKSQRLPPKLYLQLVTVFAASGHVETAARLLSVLLKKLPDLPGISTALWKLAGAYKQKGLKKKWKHCRKIILMKYPESSEAQLIKRRAQRI